MEHLTQALSIHRASGNRHGEATTLTNVGGVHSTLGEKQKALEYFTQARDLYRAIGDSVREARMSSKIGEVSSALGRNISDRGEKQKRSRRR